MTTSIALLCRFYSFSLEQTLMLTIRQFIIMMHEIEVIIELETGSSVSSPHVLAGEKMHKYAMKHFGGKR